MVQGLKRYRNWSAPQQQVLPQPPNGHNILYSALAGERQAKVSNDISETENSDHYWKLPFSWLLPLLPVPPGQRNFQTQARTLKSVVSQQTASPIAAQPSEPALVPPTAIVKGGLPSPPTFGVGER